MDLAYVDSLWRKLSYTPFENALHDRPNSLRIVKIHHSYCILVTRPVILSKKEVRLIWCDLSLTSLCWLFLITLLYSRNLQIDCFSFWVFLSITISVLVFNTVSTSCCHLLKCCVSFSSNLASPLLCSLLVTKQNITKLARMEYWKTNYISILMSFSSEYWSY